MKKRQSIFLLSLLSVFLLSGCTVPAAQSESNVPSSEQASSAPSGVTASSESSSEAPISSSAASSSQKSVAPDGSGQTVPATQPENDIHTELQYKFLKDDWKNIKTYVPYVSAETSDKSKLLGDISAPKGLAMKFDDLAAADTYYVQYSKTNDFTNAKVVTTTEKVYYNQIAEINTKYYYKAAASEEGLASATVKEVTSADIAPRNVKVDGVINFRDVGGWKSNLVPNGAVKQGLYYRCAQFNSSGRKTITAKGLETIKELNIKVDIDMRDSYNVPSTSPLSSADYPVEILKGSVASGTEDGRWEGTHSRDTNIAATYKKIFEAIAVADQKPIALHCTHGADRTGIVSFFLLALLGVSKDDCGRDYVLTRFAGERAVLPDNEIKNWIDKTEALQGGNFAEKTYKHLHDDFGIEVDTLETIREKFVPGYQRAA